MAANDGIRRGDAARTGDMEAKPPVNRGAQIDDGPAGRPVGDASEYDPEAVLESGDESLEGLSIVNEDDPSLGLTNFRDKGPDDWAADTEESHNPPSRLTTDHFTDRSSTLTPKK
jgi:hypothetical protein